MLLPEPFVGCLAAIDQRGIVCQASAKHHDSNSKSSLPRPRQRTYLITPIMTLTHPKAPSMATLACLQSALSTLRTTHHAVPAITHITRRKASHQAQGRANGAKDGAGKRLGAKKTGGEYVVPGNILFRQRGTHWFPGDNCFMVCYHTRQERGTSLN